MIVKKLKEIEAFIAGDETKIREWLHPKNGDPDTPYSLAYATLEPGKSSLPHHLEERSEVYIVLEGSGTAYVNGEAVRLSKKELLFIPPGAEQFVTNDGEVTLEILCIVTPPWDKDTEVVQPT
ncbi:MAG: hypothetical protein DHS20C18_09910 [Saprospiraceae bacterium]|nr:MAG: hypothetical protein DHS20C18_09910 [Saprospiraceae bacterium]